jgi:chitinase
MGRTPRRFPELALVVAAASFLLSGCSLDTQAGADARPGGGGDARPGPDGALAGDGGDPTVTPVSYDVHLRTESSGQYLSAQNAGGGDVNAAAPVPREWEQFRLIDVNGGALDDGDQVYFLAFDGASYLRAENGGGGAVDARGTSMGDFESFQIVRATGTGPIYRGDHVGLRTRIGQQFVSAAQGGGGAVTATATERGAWEHFVIDGVPPDPTDPVGMRVIGYLPSWYGSYADWAGRVDFSRLTHVNLAFALGDDDGNLQLAPGNEIDAFVTAAHAAGVEVFPSLCGGGGDGRIAPHYAPDRVDDFVDKILAFVAEHDFDGIDVDVEAPQRMGENYDVFIAKLKEKAAPLGLPVTAAVAQWMQDGMSNDTLRSFDWITIMSYDNAGTWTGPGEHASYAQAQEAIDFYIGRGVAPENLVLGVPFYGYCWGNCGNGSSVYVLYKDILDRHPDAWTTDWIQADGATYSYNGVATMQAKTDLAGQYGGIMIWELGGDLETSDSHSLLLSIDDAQ